MPAAAPMSGTAACRGDASGPPSRVASTISLAASAKKNTIATSFTAKCTACARRAYDDGAALAQPRAISVPATSNSDRSMTKAANRVMTAALLGETLHVQEVGVGPAQVGIDVDEHHHRLRREIHRLADRRFERAQILQLRDDRPHAPVELEAPRDDVRR